MNNLQKTALGVAILAVAFIYLHPPWIEYYTVENGGYARRELGHHFLWEKPVQLQAPTSHGARVWSSRRSQYFLAAGSVAFVLYLLAGRTTVKNEIPARRD